MTTPSSVPGARTSFDIGPLSWVMGEIREALSRSKTAVQDALAQDSESQTTSIRQAKAYLHQAHGALQIVDIDGVPAITEAIEDILTRMESGAVALNAELCSTLSDSFQAVVEYLEELLAGASHQPVRLFPYYRSLMELRGAEKIHPSDLFFPNLSVQLQLAAAPTAATPNYAALRQHFEKALLSVLKSSDQTAEGTSLTVMQKALAEIEGAQTSQQARTFWWVMHGLAEAVLAGKIKNELYVKQLFARINLQIRRLSEGSAGISERILRDALFFIAGAIDQDLPPRVQQIRTAFRLHGMVPPDYRQKHYAQINAEALTLAKEELANAKGRWNRIAGGDVSAAQQFEQDMAKLAEAGSHLNSPSLSKLLRELSGIARHAAHANPGESLGLEIAASLLFVENALNYPSRLSEDFSEKADAMTARLLSIVVGEVPSAKADWLDDMSRQAQQRQTMAVLAAEMQASLAQVEKMLDEYFSNPAKRTMLATIDSVLHQIEGAMSILDQEDATNAIKHVRSEIRRFEEADADTAPDQHSLQRVAQNIGALSFFIETLQLSAETGRKRFVFDEKLGVFQANLLEEGHDDNVPFVLDEAELPAPTSKGSESAAINSTLAFPTVEEDLAQQQQRSAELARSLVAEPGNESLQDQLKESLLRVRSDAALVEDAEADHRAQAAIEILESPDFSPTEDTLAEIVSATAAQIPATAVRESVSTPAAVPVSDEAIDAELLEIFLGEAQEVLDCIRQTLPQLRNEPQSQDHMTTLRRSFHTLKGSGRMVGLNAFGEAAWSIEQVLNLRLSDGQGGSPNLYGLIEKAADVLEAWVNDLINSGHSHRTPDAVIAAAARVKQGEDFFYDETAAEDLSVTDEGFDNENPEQISLPPLDVQQDDVPLHAFDMQMNSGEVPLLDEDLAALESSAEFVEMGLPVSSEIEVPLPEEGVDNFAPTSLAALNDIPQVRPVEQQRDANVKRIGDVEISLPLHNIYLAETDDLVRLLTRDFAEWRQEPERNVNILAVHAAHSLAGSSATVGLDSLYQVAHALEMVLQTMARKSVKPLMHEFDALDKSVECLTFMLEKFALDEMPQHEPLQVQQLQDLLQQVSARAGNDANEVQSGLPKFADASLEPEEIVAVPVSEPAWEAHDPVEELPKQETVLLQPSAYEQDIGRIEADQPSAVTAVHHTSHSAQVALGENAVLIKDELDADLLPVFLEEGRDILPQMEQQLRTWQQNPSDTATVQMLLRNLHTIKGSARMAGAMELGQHMHVLETRIEQITRLGTPTAEAIDELLSRLDLGLYMFDQLRDPDPSRQKPIINFGMAGLENVGKAAEEPKSDALVPAVQARIESTPIVAAGQGQGAVPAAPVPQVRVRADILDRLVNQAGEVSISRSKVETEVDTLRQSLGELTENVSRLRTQLREIEIQAETQIASQMAHAADREFDPLEFDRFTRLQELTRSMAESVNDVATVQQNLLRTVDGATEDLTAQARLTRELQQDLMRVRMVQFASISERLYRVTRQASKELDKRVNLDIRGGSVEIDRGVLEKMAGPFEHLLRNAIVHGIESREARIASGKAEIGELLIEIRQEGNEVVMQFSDDGQGLNLNRIREKARTVGLLADDKDVSVAELQDMIFHPGFSTAQEVTELAGRGVGMDVVRAEAASLGGRISIESEQGKGARFTIRLPLTLAVTQVVLVSTGGRSYALPSVLVEQVQQLRANPLAAAYNDGAIMWQGNRVPLYYLSALLGDKTASPIAQQYSPVVILKSGSERTAIHVDQIAGNREVVVKNIGPQLARMLGIAGATVLGSGEIVLILNPVQLAHRELQEEVRAPRLLPSDAPAEMGAVAEMASQVPSKSSAQPVQGLRTQHIVMVVDDSLTVRRVTQRFLSREGYQVVLAKDGVDALEQLQSVTPDVMLVDIEMPRMDGFDLTRNVRNDERTRHIAIIMITSRTAAKHRNYAMELGVNEYLGKPYQESELLKHVAGFVNKTEPVA
ncbi:Hpt domain-containing protein [Oxalobacteraceae bacterium R-40]|uniref:histidine kinase n=1 Tax=Keguizhuia sedimenti TaxID=3064264 RepID=A0ABU1BT72_9BURK|nr:Hpt domain-containing protein [Oxalobacteraceae bacterium R-40]